MRHKLAPASAKEERETNPDPPGAPEPEPSPGTAAAIGPTAAPEPAAGPKPGVDAQLAAALMELDLDAAKRLSHRVGPLKNINFPGQLQDQAATERANRSTLDEMAASLGISRSAMSRILDGPPPRVGGKHAEHKGGAKRHDHGSGRRRHSG